ncbi:hypothetical protein BWI15_11490 [Kribbella sp. ALI-6-A]|uniref:hypothetical protein n=1 Tax=Kribbella sp. ALI-6-A TaxID=1933817 RepID=UPI00097BE71B|nr:hypothetical protein [Kribbella sp. ALI-6-A]ONI74001.1 hypothetical protein BWI15_11490 [Kribbella sp. ALI-6-A]
MGLFGRRRHPQWPRIDMYTPGSPSDIKRLTLDDLDRLMTKAESAEFSAVGRPAWLEQHRSRIRQQYLIVFGPEGDGAYRCYAAALLDDDSGHLYTLDVATQDFDELPGVTQQELVALAHRFLMTFSPVPLDPEQQA